MPRHHNASTGATTGATKIKNTVEDPQGDTLEERAEDLRSSWETITRSGLVWNLEGWMGRQARNLLADGVITLGVGEE